LQTSQEVKDEGEYHDREKGNWHINDRKSGSFDEWMVHSSFRMLDYNGPLCEESRDLGN